MTNEPKTTYSRQKTKPVEVPEGKKEVRVTAITNYSNGMLEQKWKRGETRLISVDLLKRIEQDLPGNWKVGE